MKQTLHLDSNLQEKITFNTHNLPIVTCIDDLNDYYDQSWDAHWHEGIEFMMVLKGEIEVTLWEKTTNPLKTKIKSNNGIFINNEVLHQIHGLTPHTKLACFIIPLSFFDFTSFETLKNKDFLPIIRSNTAHFLLKESTQSNMLQAILNLCELSEKEVGYEIHTLELFSFICRQLLLQFNENHLLQSKKTKESIQTQRVKKIIQFIHENFQKRINIDDMSAFANISRAECFRSFKTILKQTPNDYLNNYRLSMATMMLISTQKTISEIAENSGFQTLSYFNHCFRDKYQMTPGQYRKSKR